MEKQKQMKMIKTIIFIVFLVIICLLTYLGFTQKKIGDYIKTADEKYEECIRVCEEEKTCIERESNPSGGRLTESICIKYSDVECKYICVYKYK